MKTQATPPTATAARMNNEIFCMVVLPASAPARLVRYFRGIERGGEPLLLAVVARPIPEARAADTGRAMLADDVALRVLTGHVVDENVLGDDDVAFHADDLGDVGDAARSVAQARGLHDDVDRPAQHFPDRARGKRIAAHGDH